jgi:hypothetical protein
MEQNTQPVRKSKRQLKREKLTETCTHMTNEELIEMVLQYEDKIFKMKKKLKLIRSTVQHWG